MGQRARPRRGRTEGDGIVGEGLQFAALATAVGKKNGARWFTEPVTISAVGYKGGERYVMATTPDGTVILGAPGEFSLAPKRRKGTA